MSRSFAAPISILFLASILTSAFAVHPSQAERIWNINQVSDSTVYIPVPFHHQIKTYYCGPAALEMVFDFYGEDIPQKEIADAARTSGHTYWYDLRRAAHFSNLSTSQGNEMVGDITGYSAREFGYAGFEKRGLTIDDLKTLLNKGRPIIVCMWFNPSKVYAHYRVVVGYNETHIITHDPWILSPLWEGQWGGANTSFTYSLFLDLWSWLGNWGLLVCPFDIELQMRSTITKGDTFEVIANITYPFSAPFDIFDYPASSCIATIELIEGLELGLGETAQHSLGNISAGNSVETSWLLNATETGLVALSVTVTGTIKGSVQAHDSYSAYDYTDKIGGSYKQISKLQDLPPAASFFYAPNNPKAGQEIGFIDTSSHLEGKTITYQWDFGDTYTSTTKNPTHKYVKSGTYTVTLTVMDDDGVSDTETMSITVRDLYLWEQTWFLPLVLSGITVIVIGAIVISRRK